MHSISTDNIGVNLRSFADIFMTGPNVRRECRYSRVPDRLVSCWILGVPYVSTVMVCKCRTSRLIIGRSSVRVTPGPPFIPLLGIADSRLIIHQELSNPTYYGASVLIGQLVPIESGGPSLTAWAVFLFTHYHWNLKATVYGCTTLVTKVV